MLNYYNHHHHRVVFVLIILRYCECFMKNTTCIVAPAMRLALHHLLCRISRDEDKVITFETARIVGGVYVEITFN